MKKITPADLQQKCCPIDVNGKYDWKKQVYQYAICKAGTYASTSHGTQRSSTVYDTGFDSVMD